MSLAIVRVRDLNPCIHLISLTREQQCNTTTVKCNSYTQFRYKITQMQCIGAFSEGALLEAILAPPLAPNFTTGAPFYKGLPRLPECGEAKGDRNEAK